MCLVIMRIHKGMIVVHKCHVEICMVLIEIHLPCELCLAHRAKGSVATARALSILPRRGKGMERRLGTSANEAVHSNSAELYMQQSTSENRNLMACVERKTLCKYVLLAKRCMSSTIIRAVGLLNTPGSASLVSPVLSMPFHSPGYHQGNFVVLDANCDKLSHWVLLQD